jgi:uncharacterized protein (DUF1684 family)
VFELYAEVRRARDVRVAWSLWRDTRDELFATHPQSPLPKETRATFTGLPYYDYDPELRVLATVEPAERVQRQIATSGAHPYSFTRFARAVFSSHGQGLSLDVYWLDGYGGGVYVCFADATSGDETYGAGRYLLDTVKGSDLGTEGGQLTLDYTHAYNPSCSYDPRWGCPLAPPANRLPIAVRGGERHPL